MNVCMYYGMDGLRMDIWILVFFFNLHNCNLNFKFESNLVDFTNEFETKRVESELDLLLNYLRWD